MLSIMNEPFTSILQAAEELKPGLKVTIQFDPSIWFFKLGFLKLGHCGETWFHNDGSEPAIFISVNIPFKHVPEILVHELAHVIVGNTTCKHDKVWKDTFHNLFARAHERYDEQYQAAIKSETK
jgi:hypothetical protein